MAVRCDLEAQQIKTNETVEIFDNSSIQDDEPRLTHRYRCRGEGKTGRITHWVAMGAPKCRGKWLRLTVGPPKKCRASQFIFV